MSDSSEQFESVKALFSDAQLQVDGDKSVAIIPSVTFPSGGIEHTMRLLLYPHQHSGYQTRLFFERPLSIGDNWNSHFVCDETWYAPSRQGVTAEQSWASILAQHLRAVR